ncbi:MAG: hypothetical protein RI947_861 [Candidatus Parcubacteria bacterium]|jgi:SAM-dependent methyltransferase
MSAVLCPICSSLYTRLFHTILSYRYFICTECVTLFLFPAPQNSEIDHFYETVFSYADSNDQRNKVRERTREILHALKKLYRDGKTLLDIGPGLGYMMEEATQAGIESYGVEPSEYLYKQLVRKGFSVSNTSFLQCKTDRKYDYICLIHVLEHVPNPEAVVRKAYDMLNKGGVLYIETPNLDSHLFYSERTNYTFLTPPEHLWIFSLHTFKYIFPGYSPIRTETYTPVEHAVGMIRAWIHRPKRGNTTSTGTKSKSSTIHPRSMKYKIMHEVLGPHICALFNIGYKGSILAVYYTKT